MNRKSIGRTIRKAIANVNSPCYRLKIAPVQFPQKKPPEGGWKEKKELQAKGSRVIDYTANNVQERQIFILDNFVRPISITDRLDGASHQFAKSAHSKFPFVDERVNMVAFHLFVGSVHSDTIVFL